ncbi:type II toxin-antitoxin system PemK/MazF family toxin [Pseudomonas mosselii]|nr:type II toxin-antitoxin system PemK/MazF family toxin [Pseudomonas mosselii]
MIKVRPVVILRSHRHNSQLVTVVPLSTTAPEILEDHHIELPSQLDGGGNVCWAKCDMVYTVSLGRLDRCRVRSRHGGGRQYVVFKLEDSQFSSVQKAVSKALGL